VSLRQLAYNVAENLGGQLSCTECTGQGNDFGLILMVKMQTRHSVDGYFSNKFPSICNHCGVMVAWSCKMLEKISFFGGIGKTTASEKLSKFCSKRIHRRADLCCVQILWNLADRKSVKSCVAYLTKNFAWLSSSRYCEDRAQNLPGLAPDDVPRVLQISSKSVHFRQSCYSRTCEHHQNGP